MPYLFKPPTVEEGPAGFTRLFWRYRIARANSILIKDGIVTSVRTPAVQDTQSADYCYLGGSEYVITQTEKDILTGAGYGDNITPIS